MWARAEGKPLWALVADFTPEQFVSAVPFQYLTDALDPGAARELLEERAAGKAERRAEMERDGFPAYTTSAGWLGYTEEEIRRLAREAVAEGWNDVKMKVGGPPEDDAKRAAILREEIGMERRLMMDANQVWDVPEAIEKTLALKEFEPYWMEEPTSPDDVLGHAAIARGDRAGQGRHRRALHEPRAVQAAHAGERDRRLPGRRLPARRRQRGARRAAARRPLRRARCARTPAASACASSPSTSRSSTTSAPARASTAACSSTSTTCTSTSPTRCGCAAAATSRPSSPATRRRSRPESLDEFEFPGGAAWRS